MGVAEAFFGPSYTGLVPEVVSPPRLQQANALQGLVVQRVDHARRHAGRPAGRGGGPRLGHRHRRAQLPGQRRLPLAAAAGAVPGRAAAGPPRRGRPTLLAGEEPAAGDSAGERPEGFFRDLAAGWHEFRRHTWIWVTVIGAAAFLFAVDGPLQVLGPIVAEDVYAGARTWGLTSAAMGIGQIAGGLLGLRWRPRRPILVICGGMWLAALPVAFLALEVPVWALYAAMVAIGVEWGLYDPFWMTCMQRVVPRDMISRVAAYDWFCVLAFYPAGLALAGPLADAVGRSAVLWGAAAVAVAVSVFQVLWRDVRAPHDMGPPSEAASAAAPSADPGRRSSERLSGGLPLGVQARVASAAPRRAARVCPAPPRGRRR